MSNKLAEELRIQQEGMQNYHSYRERIAEVQGQLYELETQMGVLNLEWKQKNRRIDELKKRGISNFFLRLIGKYKKILKLQLLEAADIKSRFENKQLQVEEVKKRVLYMQEQQSECAGCERRYRELYEKRLNELLSKESAAKRDIEECRTWIMESERVQKELKEAMTAGNRVLNVLQSVEHSLNQAAGYGTWDIVGGGTIATMAKHSQLDDAKSKLNMVQSLMREFNKELKDVTVNLEIQIDTDGFAKFADYFFDGLVADIAMQNRIYDAKGSVVRSKDKINQVLRQLERVCLSEVERVKALEEQISTIVISSEE